MASRRGAEDLIRAGRVSLNGRRALLGESADPGRDAIAVDGAPIEREPLVYWMVHKPRGVLTTVRDPFGRPTIVDLVSRARARLFPVGRLDRDSAGLVLLTNDGPLAHALLHPSRGHERDYRVTVRGRVSAGTFRHLARGVSLEDGPTAPAEVFGVRSHPDAGTTSFTLTLREGRKRQIRRALRALGHPVVSLLRVRFGPLRLGGLAPGDARSLTARERTRLLRDARSGPSRPQLRARSSLRK